MVRQAERRAHLDLQVNLLAEQESTATLELLRRVCDRLGISTVPDCRVDELAAETDLQTVIAELDQRLPDPAGPEGSPEPR
jgi:uncharacterized membrane protein